MDGPLSRRPPETLRYGTGRCALGALLVASSDRGIVSIMVRDTQARLIRDLDARFPKAKLVRDERGCKALVAKVAFPAPARHPRHRAAAACLERGSQDPLRRDLHLHEDCRSHRQSEGDSRRGELLLEELVRLRRSVPPRAARRRDASTGTRRPPVRMGRLRGEARREAAALEVVEPWTMCLCVRKASVAGVRLGSRSGRRFSAGRREGDRRTICTQSPASYVRSATRGLTRCMCGNVARQEQALKARLSSAHVGCRARAPCKRDLPKRQLQMGEVPASAAFQRSSAVVRPRDGACGGASTGTSARASSWRNETRALAHPNGVWSP